VGARRAKCTRPCAPAVPRWRRSRSFPRATVRSTAPSATAASASRRT